MTEQRQWTDPQRKMMRAAGRYYTARGAVVGLILVGVMITGLAIQRQIAEQEQAHDARGLVRAVISAEIGEVPKIIDSMAESRKWVDPLLREAVENQALSPQQKLHAILALLRVDSGFAESVYDRLLQAVPDEIPVLCDELTPYQDQFLPRLWEVAGSSDKGQAAKRLRAASALAAFDPDGDGWTPLSPLLAEQLVTESPYFSRIWHESFRPVKSKLFSSLAGIYRDHGYSEYRRTAATNFLADYAEDQPELLANLLMDGDEKQFAVMFPEFKEQSDQAVPFLMREIELSVLETSDDRKESLAKRQANAAVALLRINRAAKIWPILKHSADPRARSYLIHRFFSLGADPDPLLKQFEVESDITIRRALLLSLGEFDEQTLPPETRSKLIPKLREMYRTDADPGLHAASEWLLRTWKDDTWLKQTINEWVADQERRRLRFENIQSLVTNSEQKPSHDWYVNGQGQTLLVVPGPTEFIMGSPNADPTQVDKERQHTRRISRSFSIATTTVTFEQYRKFDAEYGGGYAADWLRAPDLPAIGLSWFMGALYCNWLSEQEGIPADQQCFSIKGQVCKLKKNYLNLNGYRYPTEAEMEYATRADSVTTRYFGETDELLPHYAWYQGNSQEKFWPVGTRKPNDFGLFDSLGNVFTWCQGSYQLYPEGEIVEDTDDDLLPYNSKSRALRGGAFIDRPPLLRSAFRNADLPVTRSHNFGFRVARTIAQVPVTSSPPDTAADTEK